MVTQMKFVIASQMYMTRMIQIKSKIMEVKNKLHQPNHHYLSLSSTTSSSSNHQNLFQNQANPFIAMQGNYLQINFNPEDTLGLLLFVFYRQMLVVNLSRGKICKQ